MSTDTVGDLATLCANGFTAIHLAHIVQLLSDGPLETAVDVVKILTFESPKGFSNNIQGVRILQRQHPRGEKMARQQQLQAVTRIRVNGDSKQFMYFHFTKRE